MDTADLIKEACGAKKPVVIATIIHVEGHAYRKPGASMLLYGDGTTGTLSPGCLEADLQGYVPAILAHQAAQIVEYDMRPEDDLSWGEQIGCGGYLRILLEPLTPALRQALNELNRRVEAGLSARFVRVFKDAYACRPLFYRIEPLEAECSWSDNEFAQLIEPKPRLVLFGAGDDARSVSEFAQRAGFRVTVTDFRPAFCTAERFPGAKLDIGFPKEMVWRLELSERDYVVVMSHNYPRDCEFVNAVLKQRVTYLGIMGSIGRTQRMLSSLEVPDWVHYPVGLAIHSDGPEEIAFSIVGQLIQIRRGGNELEQRGGTDHNRPIARSRQRRSNGSA